MDEQIDGELDGQRDGEVVFLMRKCCLLSENQTDIEFRESFQKIACI